MDLKEINKLLKKYYEGSASEEEEAFIKNFFAQNEVPPSLKLEKQWFSYLNTEQKLANPPHNLEEKMESLISRENRKNKIISMQLDVVNLAASAVLVFGIFWWNTSQTDRTALYKDTYEDPALAYENVKNTLEKIAGIVQKNTTELNHLSTVQTGLNKIQLLEEHMNDLTPKHKKQ